MVRMNVREEKEPSTRRRFPPVHHNRSACQHTTSRISHNRYILRRPHKLVSSLDRSHKRFFSLTLTLNPRTRCRERVRRRKADRMSRFKLIKDALRQVIARLLAHQSGLFPPHGSPACLIFLADHIPSRALFAASYFRPAAGCQSRCQIHLATSFSPHFRRSPLPRRLPR